MSVIDAAGQPLADAGVVVSTRDGLAIASTYAASTGFATLDSLPATVNVLVNHKSNEPQAIHNVNVAQSGLTNITVTLAPSRSAPSVALLPPSVPADSVSMDRSELALEVELVASAKARFTPAQYGDYWTGAPPSPSLGLTVGEWEDGGGRDCSVWLDRTRTAPSCGPWITESPYAVSVVRYTYDPVGTTPPVVASVSARSAMLLMDQSERVRRLDPEATRSFAARAFIVRETSSAPPASLAIAGFAGDGNGPGSSSPLPERPLWWALGAGADYSTDRATLTSAIQVLEPMVGGSSPVYAALHAALARAAAQAPAGNRVLVTLLGGGDDGVLTEAERRSALESLRRERDQAGIQAILVAATSNGPRAEREALAELAAALRAPAISLAQRQMELSGLFSALDLAADLAEGQRLPTLSATFLIKAREPGAFPAGATLHGAVYVDSDQCPFDCLQIALPFAVQIP